MASGVSFLALSASIASAPGLNSAAFAAGSTPSGGQFTAGAGAIAPTANGLSITQSTSRGVIDWQSFSIGQGNAVNIANGSGATLNRVTGGNISNIAGSLTSTGSVYVINPAGIVVMPTGQVVTTGSFVASTRDVSNSSFMAGGAQNFKGNSTGTVVNQGSITSANGDVTLIGQSVTNSGRISAPNGTAGLAAGNDVLLQPASDPEIVINAGTGDATNSGNIAAAQAELAAAGGNVYALATNNGGVIRATGSTTKNGHVYLTAGGNVTVAGTVSATNADGSGGTVKAIAGSGGGALSVTGAVDVSAIAASAKGGTATLTGNTVNVGSTAIISANGGMDGGNIFIGGDRHGGTDPSVALSATPISNAQYTTVSAGANIAANGGWVAGTLLGGAGNGGNVVVWSNISTNYAGAISAKGGASGGNGGFVEVSGEQLAFTGTVNTLAPLGGTGTLLLDPSDVTIVSPSDANLGGNINPAPTSGAPVNETVSGASGSPQTYTPTGVGGTNISSGTGTNSSYILTTDIQTALASNDVTITTSNAAGTNQGNIHLGTSQNGASISWNTNKTLTLTADGIIDMPGGSNIDGASGLASGLYANGSGNIVLNAAGGGVTNANLSSGGTVITVSSAISANGGTISLNATGTQSGLSPSPFLIVVSNGITVSNTTTNGAGLISIISDQLRVGNGGFAETGAITTTGNVTLQPLTAGAKQIGNNSTVGPSFSTYSFINNTALINDKSVANITANNLIIGSTNTTSITLTTPTSNAATIAATHTNNLELLTGPSGSVSQDANTPLSVFGGTGGLAISTGGAINLTLANLVGSVAMLQTGAGATGGDILFDGQTTATSSGTLNIGTVNGIAGITTVGAGSTVTLLNSGAVTQSTSNAAPVPAITTPNLVLEGGGSFTLNNLANAVSNIAASVSSLSFTDASSLTITSLSDNLTAPTTYNGIAATGAVTIADKNVLTIANIGAGAITSTGGSVTLEDGSTNYGNGTVVASSGFINNDTNPNPISVVAGQTWRIYSQDPRNDVDGTLNNTTNASFVQYGAANYYGAPNAGGAGTSASPSPFVNANNVLTASSAAAVAANAGNAAINGNGFLYTVAPNVSESVTNAFTKVYDGTDNLPSPPSSIPLTYSSLSGAINNDTVTVTQLPNLTLPASHFYNGNVNVGNGYVISVANAIGLNTLASMTHNAAGVTVYGYTPTTSAAGTASITPKPVTITGTRAYNQNTTTLTSTYSSIASQLIGADATNVSLSGTGVNALSSANAGSYSTGAGTLSLTNLSLTGTGSSNYAITSGTYTVTPFAITVTGTRNYDTTTTAVSSAFGSITGQELAGDPPLTITGTASVASPNASVTAQALTTSAGTVSGLSLSGTGSGNYAITSGTLTINKAPVTIAGTRIYDSTTTAANTTFTTPISVASGVFVSDSANVGITGSGTLGSANVGSYASANGTAAVSNGITLGTLGLNGTASSNYTLVGATYTVTAAQLAIANGTKVYDGLTTVPSVDITSLSGLQGGDAFGAGGDLTVSGTGSITSANVGSYTGGASAFSVTGLTLGGSAAANYTLSPGTFTVTAKPITITGIKIYDGNTTTATPSYNSINAQLIVGDVGSVSLSGTGLTALGSANVGSYSSTNSGATNLSLANLSLTGGHSGNYALVSGTYTVTAKPITITGSKTYDGSTTTLPSTYGSITAQLIAGDTGNVSLSGTGVSALNSPNAGSYTSTGGTPNLSLTNLSLTGSAANNYSLVSGTYTVNQAPAITITASPQSKTYGTVGNLGTTAFTTTGLVGGDTVGGVTLASAGTPATANAGAYNILPSNETGGTFNPANYTGVNYVNGVLTVNPATLLVSANPQTKVYGSTDPALTYNETGLANGDPNPLTGTLTRTPGETVAGGPYAISQGTLASANANYTISYTGNNLTITAKPITITGSKSYDATATAAASTFGALTPQLVGSDAVTLAGSGTLGSANAGSYSSTNSGSAGLPLAGLSLTGAGASNYALIAANYTVSPEAIVITAVPTTKTYDGTPSSPGTPVVTSGIIYPADPGTLTQTYGGPNAGTGLTLTPTGTFTNSTNYTVTYVPVMTGVINPAPLTLNGTRVYDGATDAPGSILTASGEIPGDPTLTVTGTGTVASPNVGATPLVSLGSLTLVGSGSGNYTISGGTVTITPAQLILGAVNTTKVYDGTTVSNGTPAVSGLIGSDTISALTQTYNSRNVLGTNGSTLTVSPGYTITDGNGGGNYIVVVNTSPGTITPESITVIGTPVSKPYDRTPGSPGVPVIVNGRLYGPDIGIFTETYGGPNAGTNLTLTPTGTITDGNGGGNYVVTYVPVTTGTITPLPVILFGTRVYDGTTNAAASILTFTNDLDGSNLTLSGNGVLIAPSVGLEPIFSFTGLALGGSAAGNYTLAGAIGNVQVTPDPPTQILVPLNQTASGVSEVPSDFTIYDGGILYVKSTQNGIVTGTIATIDGQEYQPDNQLGCTLSATGACVQSGIAPTAGRAPAGAK